MRHNYEWPGALWGAGVYTALTQSSNSRIALGNSRIALRALRRPRVSLLIMHVTQSTNYVTQSSHSSIAVMPWYTLRQRNQSAFMRSPFCSYFCPFKQNPKPLPLLPLFSCYHLIQKVLEIQSNSKAILSKCTIFVGNPRKWKREEKSNWGTKSQFSVSDVALTKKLKWNKQKLDIILLKKVIFMNLF